MMRVTVTMLLTALLLVLVCALAACDAPYKPPAGTEPPGPAHPPTIWVDTATGCQYLRFGSSSTLARLGPNGLPLCGLPAKPTGTARML